MRALAGEGLHTMTLMVEEERRNVDQLRQDQAAAASSSGAGAASHELDTAVKRLGRLEKQLKGMKSGKVNASAYSNYHLLLEPVSLFYTSSQLNIGGKKADQ